MQVNATAIEQICKERLKLDGDEVMDPSNLQALSSTVGKLQRAAEAAQGAGGEVPILDPEKDLKINQLDMVTAIRERQQLMQVDKHKSDSCVLPSFNLSSSAAACL